MRKGLSKYILVLLLLSGAECASAQKFVRVNQIGYGTSMPKIATIVGMNASNYEIKDKKTNTVVYSGEVKEGKYWDLSRETIQNVDFSEFNKEGDYYLQVDDEKSYPFTIASSNTYRELLQGVIRAFYYWRSSTAIEPPYSAFKGKDYSRAMGHPDTFVYVHQSAATEKRHVESVISSPKGWYDAGDYNKYVVNAGITLHQMMLSYEMFPEYYKDLNLNIPESGNGLPDLYNEIKWETDWLFTMQDPDDGGVYHKLTTLRFSGFVQPVEDKADRYVVTKTTAAALDYAATMAMVYRIFKLIDTPYAEKALASALKAYQWAEANPNILYNNPKDVRTGTYGDSDVSDEQFWAAAELFLATGEKAYYQKLDFFQKFDSPTWNKVNTLGLISLRMHSDELPSYVDKKQLDNKFKSLVHTIYNQFKFSPGRLALKKFVWGSNGDIAINGNLMGIAYQLYKDKKYLDAMVGNFDYLLGSNPTDYCFITCFGSKYPKHLHDRRCASDGIVEPIPGYLCGGANPNQVSDCGQLNYPSLSPARCYLDQECSYSTNEIAINWNAPLILLISMMENMK